MLTLFLVYAGEDVPVNEQINTADKKKTEILELLDKSKNAESAAVAKLSDAERQHFDEERTKLYKQLDERV